MRDRLKAVGGQLIVSSRPGAGTCVFGLVPSPAAARDHPVGTMSPPTGMISSAYVDDAP
jgi:hypothetical protein